MIRALFRFLFSAVGILVAVKVVPGLGGGRFVELLGVAVLLSLLNATLGTFLKALTMVPRACSFGCLTLVINGLLFWLAAYLSQFLGLGFHVRGFWSALFGALLSSVIAALLEGILLGKEGKEPPASRPTVKILN